MAAPQDIDATPLQTALPVAASEPGVAWLMHYGPWCLVIVLLVVVLMLLALLMRKTRRDVVYVQPLEHDRVPDVAQRPAVAPIDTHLPVFHEPITADEHVLDDEHAEAAAIAEPVAYTALDESNIDDSTFDETLDEAIVDAPAPNDIDVDDGVDADASPVVTIDHAQPYAFTSVPYSPMAGVHSLVPASNSPIGTPFDQQERHYEPPVREPASFAPVFQPEVETTAMTSAPEAAAETPAGAEAIASAIAAKPAEGLLQRLEHLAWTHDPSRPAFFIEEFPYLPVIVSPGYMPLAATLVERIEAEIRRSLHAEGLPATWLLVQALSLRIGDAPRGEVDGMHAEAVERVEQGLAQVADAARGYWTARQILADLALLRRQSGATRLLGLRDMRPQYAGALAFGHHAVLEAWVRVLLFQATCVRGNGIHELYHEAEATCLRMAEHADHRDDAQCLRAEVLVQRAGTELGAVPANTLEQAQTLLDDVFARQPTSHVAIAVARTALARGKYLMPEQAKEVYSHALRFAYLAGQDPFWQAEALQCRLAIQLAYESLPETGQQGDVALSLAAQIEALPQSSPDTVHRMAQTYLRNGDYARASQLCESAWREGTDKRAVLATWQDASTRWAQALIQPHHNAAWQRSERQRRLASHLH